MPHLRSQQMSKNDKELFDYYYYYSAFFYNAFVNFFFFALVKK